MSNMNGLSINTRGATKINTNDIIIYQNTLNHYAYRIIFTHVPMVSSNPTLHLETDHKIISSQDSHLITNCRYAGDFDEFRSTFVIETIPIVHSPEQLFRIVTDDGGVLLPHRT